MRHPVEITGSVLLALSLAAVARAQPVERLVASIHGGVTITGNSLGLSKQPQANGPGTSDGIGTLVTTDVGSIDTLPANPSNPWFQGTTNDYTESSSAARLRLPVGASVVHAELVWSGSYLYVEDVSAVLDDPVLLAAESGASTPVTPDPTTATTLAAMLPSGAAANYYVRSANVTPFVQSEGPGFYTVSAVPATQSEVVDTLQAAGWALVVAYAAPMAPKRNLRIVVDGRLVDETSSADVVFSGLDVPPTGQVEGQLLVAALEGDANRTGDGVAISADGGMFLPLSGPNNPLANFFASQINEESGALDTEGTFGGRNHDALTGSQTAGGRQGWDVTSVALSQQAGHVENDQTSATVRVSTTGDELVLAAVALQISAVPDFRVFVAEAPRDPWARPALTARRR